LAASRRLSPLFKLAFLTLLGLTLAFFAAGITYSVFIPNPTESQSEAADQLFQAATYTLTALVGLFAGKVA
jgi:hypothetical protein